jgi:8-oxo-dGTP pyrophosphatase MutT (NUDIX family)
LAVCGIVCDSEKNYLLTRRNEKMRTFSKAWVFPGGMVDTGEDLD